MAQDVTGGRHLIVLDPWPAPGQVIPKPEVRIDLTSSRLRHPDIAGLVFEKMRRVSGTPFPLAATGVDYADPATGTDAGIAEQAGSD